MEALVVLGDLRCGLWGFCIVWIPARLHAEGRIRSDTWRVPGQYIRCTPQRQRIRTQIKTLWQARKRGGGNGCSINNWRHVVRGRILFICTSSSLGLSWEGLASPPRVGIYGPRTRNPGWRAIPVHRADKIGPLGGGNRFPVCILFLEHLALHVVSCLTLLLLAMARHLSYLVARNNIRKQQVSHRQTITDWCIPRRSGWQFIGQNRSDEIRSFVLLDPSILKLRPQASGDSFRNRLNLNQDSRIYSFSHGSQSFDGTVRQWSHATRLTRRTLFLVPHLRS
jgi:hypothetical protein